MAVTIDPITDGDFIRLNRADAVTNWTAAGTFSMITLDTTSQVENTGCMQVRVPAGIGALTCAAAGFPGAANANLENAMLRHWIKLGQSISAGATYGARLIIGTNTNHGSWIVYTDVKQVIVYNGWMMLVVDPRKPYDAEVGTAPTDILSVAEAGSRVDYVDGNGKDLVVGDMIWQGNEVSVEGGTTGARGTLAQWATADESNGYGILRPVGGVYYLNAGVVFQGVGTADSYLEDGNRLLVFEDLPVSGSIYKIRHVGNGTGTNHFQLGVSTGSGTAQRGSGGGVIQAAGAAPFRIEAIDANIDAANYYGVTMLGPSAVYADQFRNVKVEDNGTGFTDITSNATGPDLAAINVLPATVALNDATYFGHDERFYALNINLGTGKGLSAWTGTWEYYNGTSWASLTDLTDGTNNFLVTGAQVVNFALPDDWATTAIDSDTRYWIRFRVSSFTSHSTTPQHSANGCTCDMGGDIDWEDANADIVSCTLSSMGIIRVRGGAFLKETAIADSIAPAKSAALDFGDTDPATDTVRVVSISGGVNGVVLKPTANRTYNFRAISFSGLSGKKVRIEAPASRLVTINILNNGDSIANPGDLELVGGIVTGDVTIVQSVTVTFDKMQDNTEIWVFPTGVTGIGNEIAEIEEATAGSPGDRNFSWSTSAGTFVDYIIHHWDPAGQDFQHFRVENFEVPTADVTIDISQIIDRNTT